MGERHSLEDARERRAARNAKPAPSTEIELVFSGPNGMVFHVDSPLSWQGECETCHGPLGTNCFGVGGGGMFCEACGPPRAS